VASFDLIQVAGEKKIFCSLACSFLDNRDRYLWLPDEDRVIRGSPDENVAWKGQKAGGTDYVD